MTTFRHTLREIPFAPERAVLKETVGSVLVEGMGNLFVGEEIVVQVGTPEENGPRFQLEMQAADQPEGTRQITTGREQHRAASPRPAGVDGPLDGLCIRGDPVTPGPVVANVVHHGTSPPWYHAQPANRSCHGNKTGHQKVPCVEYDLYQVKSGFG